MRIKSFFASTVEGAVALARREMGPEAILVESRRAPLDSRHLGEYEVVCAVVPEATGTPPGAPPATPPEFHTEDPRLAREMAEMRRQLELMGRTITRSAWQGSRWPSAGPEIPEWHARLLAADMDGELVNQILQSAESLAAPEGLDAAVTAEMGRRVLAGGLDAPDNLRAIALVGPPGAGKTTMLAKLAVRWGLVERRPLTLVSMDDFRVAGADQLRSYAVILGLHFEAFDSITMLSQSIERQQAKRLILIDTPGYGTRDMDRAADLASFLTNHPAIQTHLVLTASMKSADLISVAERFEIFRPSSLLFTRIDESASFGTAFSLSLRLDRPISYLGNGQEIPDDAVAATKERILSLLCPEIQNLRRAA